MKVIFLDCDGVINYTKWYTSETYMSLAPEDDLDIDSAVIERLNRLSDETESCFVISSSWKIYPGNLDRLSKAGLRNIVDKTPDLIWSAEYSRGEEISLWLKDHPEVTDYIIIDDCFDFTEEQSRHVIIVNPMYGFTEDDYTRAYKTLKS